ncbi:hypothetical protein [Pseudonocardia sp. TRM90224]|uniref:hypothetical protein n=1 Tax=Pseudonocardia sp. TRM90224 TaxID=2812678 RepID=UPI001E32DDFA|nr:hypothetical protein [Pseudonocardia sp. TRM90224]
MELGVIAQDRSSGVREGESFSRLVIESFDNWTDSDDHMVTWSGGTIIIPAS